MAEEVIVKAVCHVHSDWSYDGNWKLSKIATFFGHLGYHVVLMSEHDITFDSQRWNEYGKACDRVSTNSILVIPGMEYSDATNTVHILVWGVSDFLGKNQSTADILKKAAKRNGVCVLAHPSRREAWRLIDSSWLNLLCGIELWNRKFDGIAPSQDAINLLKSAGYLISFTGLDLHEFNQVFPLSMKIEYDGAISRESIVESIRQKRCFPSAFGLSAESFSSGIPLRCMQSADNFRRVLSRIIKNK